MPRWKEPFLWYRRRKAGKFACALTSCTSAHIITRITSTFCQIHIFSTAALHYQSQLKPPYTKVTTMAIGIFTILAGLVALAAGYFYFFGVSPETKRKMEQQALKTMGENKMSYMAKGEPPNPQCPPPPRGTPCSHFSDVH
jgi:hypothetical protein